MNTRTFLPWLGAVMILLAGPLPAWPRHANRGDESPPRSKPLGGPDEKTTHFEYKHVNYHIDDTVVLQIESLRGELLPTKEGTPCTFDDRDTMLLKIDDGKAAMSTASFALLMNRYVFNYRGTPLTNLRVAPEGNELHLTATLNKTVPVEMTGTLGATSEGRIRYHPTSIKTAGIPAKGVMDAIGLDVNKLVKGTDPRGVDVVKDDLLMDLDRLLPPPRVQAHVTDVQMDGSRVVMGFGPRSPADAPTELKPIAPDAVNYMYHRGGTIRFGRLTMTSAEIEFVDTHPEDPFDFSLTHYYDQLAAGYTKSPSNGALISYVPDYRQLVGRGTIPDLRPPAPSAATPVPEATTTP